MSARSQCRLLGINRSTFYHQPTGEGPKNLQIMEKMDRHILEEPTAGALTMWSMLQDNGITVNIKRVRRLMRLANIQPIYPRRHLTKLSESKYIYPYLLRGTGHLALQPGVGGGHHLRSDAAWLRVSDGGDRCLQPLHCGLEDQQFTGCAQQPGGGAHDH